MLNIIEKAGRFLRRTQSDAAAACSDDYLRGYLQGLRRHHREVLLHRLTDAFERVPCQETIRAVYHLREALSAFERRTERRIASLVAGTQLPHDPLAEAAGTPMGTRPWPNMDALDAAPN